MRKPSDMHQHLRQDDMLKLVAPMVAKRFAMAIIMPNTVPPITREEQLPVYWQEIRSAANTEGFKPLMTMYLTDTLDPRHVARCLANKTMVAIKYYPRGLTTNSDSGIANPRDLWTMGTNAYKCLRELADGGGVLMLHAADGFNKNGDEIDPYDQEKHFLTVTLPNLVDAHPSLKISVEHMSTAKGAEQMRFYGRTSNGRIGCSLTAHHLLLTRTDVFRGGFRPNRSWMPVIQRKEDRDELRKLASENHSFVWLGSDSAPHPRSKKESDCCASGVLMAHAGIELYAEAFDGMGALDDRFERFASVNGPKFFGLEPSEESIELVREEWKVQDIFWIRETTTPPRTEDQLVPFRLGETVQWKLAS